MHGEAMMKSRAGYDYKAKCFELADRRQIQGYPNGAYRLDRRLVMAS